MKRYVTLIAGLTLASASFVYAAEDGTMKSTDKTATDQNSSMNTLNSMNPDELEGVDIYNSDGEKIGDVDEIVKGKNGVARSCLLQFHLHHRSSHHRCCRCRRLPIRQGS